MARTKRGQGEGSVRQLTDGRWQARVMLGGKRRAYYGKTKGEALAEMRRAQAKHADGTLDRATVTLGAFLDRWLTDVVRPAGLRASTVRAYEGHARRTWVPALGDRPLRDLRGSDVQRVLADLSRRGHKPRYVAELRNTLKRALAVAVSWDLIDRNVAAETKPPRVVRDEPPVLSVEEAEAFLRAVAGHPFEAAFAVALAHGLRESEILGLRWQDVDFDAGRLRVRFQVVFPQGGGWSLVEPKTAASRRTIPLTERAVAALRAHRARQDAVRAKQGAAWADHGFVFATRVGTPTRPCKLYQAFVRARDAAGLDPTLTLHDMRHCCVSLLLAQGVPIGVVSGVLGHSSPRITHGVYAHLLPGALDEAARAMDRALTARGDE